MEDMLIWVIFLLIPIWCILILFLLMRVIFELIERRKFYFSVIETVKQKSFEVSKCTESIRNSYDVYRRCSFIWESQPIIDICQDFAVDIRNGKKLERFQIQSKSELANRLEKIIAQIREEEQFDDEKARELIEEIGCEVSSETLESVKRKLVFLEAYHKGIIGVKNAEIKNIKAKMETKKWISWVTGTLGVIGSIASIISLFR